MYQAEIIIIISIISRYVLPILFLRGVGVRVLQGQSTIKKPPSPPTITVENVHFYMFALLTVDCEESSCLVSRSRGCGFEPVHRYCVMYLGKILYPLLNNGSSLKGQARHSCKFVD